MRHFSRVRIQLQWIFFSLILSRVRLQRIAIDTSVLFLWPVIFNELLFIFIGTLLLR